MGDESGYSDRPDSLPAGSHTVLVLLEAGHKVTLIDNYRSVPRQGEGARHRTRQ